MIVALSLVVAIVGYILNGGNLPNAHRGLSLITYPTERDLSLLTSDHQSISMAQHSSIDFSTLEGKVIGPTSLPAVGAFGNSRKRLGSYNNSGEVPSGVYKIRVAFPNGTNQIIENYAIWPSSSSSFDFKHI